MDGISVIIHAKLKAKKYLLCFDIDFTNLDLGQMISC